MSSQTENGVAASESVPSNPHGDSSESAESKRPRKRRRKRSRKPEPPEAALSPSLAAPPSAFAALAGGLLSHIDEREVPCSAEGCDNTWVWAAEDQIRALGQPPPKRLCTACQTMGDTEIACAVETCKRTWIWPRDAQVKHRAWLKRQGDTSAQARKGRKRRQDGPPRRKCDACQEKWLTLQERVSVCKVHGCTREVMIDRDSQLRAWAALGTTDMDAEFPMPKRMCDVCREFCRNHGDRDVACGREGCDRTWTYKTGAQLQAFLAGRLEDPVRFCAECSKTEASEHALLGPNVEVMPCIVPACEGVWYWEPDMKISPARDGDLAPDRMCDSHRAEQGLPPRTVASQEALPEELLEASADESGPEASEKSEASETSAAPETSEALKVSVDTVV